ncbi:MAG: TM2 domain-containing protein [Bacteroidales bacterium]|nr:TM2 domain-containing protein [Bacteroidales bacterium]
MKNLKRLSLVLILGAITGSVAFASFPYSKDAKTDKTEVVQADSIVLEETTIEKENISSSQSMDEEMIITLVLWFFLGLLAAHRWYKGKPVIWNILFILTAGGFGIWWIVDLINILTDNF